MRHKRPCTAVVSVATANFPLHAIPLCMQVDVPRKVQPGDQVCTKASQMPFSTGLNHGIVLTCSRSSVIVAHFREDGVHESELFGAFTTATEVWLLDYWDSDKGLGWPAAPTQVTLDRIERQLKHPNLQPRYHSDRFTVSIGLQG